MPVDNWWVARLTKSGWTVLWSEDQGFGQASSDKIAEQLYDFQTYICEVNETVMHSSAEFWHRGEQIWKMSHDGSDSDRRNLSETGTLPDGYKQIRKKHFALQDADVENVDHIFDIPLNLAALDIGFRHEEYLEEGDVDQFLVLTAPKKKGFLSRIFGA
ncbi:hypothetical protein [Pseudaestuariivita rosea]|uniref:hypothetical protein n=1 Tax=Pseudaestuariivita rosea TaxID=2763263 RepID=UPI001ABBD63F|nr:hypothetical protein [Pseudaestuariivita rosea]